VKERNRMKRVMVDVVTMFKRCLILSMRSLDALFASIAQPILLMLLFVYVFGGAVDVGGISYVNYIVPGVILQCIGQCATITAISVNNDMKRGIIDRFRTMPITRSSLLIGHALSAVVRNIITTALLIGLAFLIGFRPTASITQWLAIIAILLLFMLAITWLSIMFGLIASSAESASSFAVVIIVLPYISSGFVTTESMPKYLRIFAENQPMTPIIEAIRSLLLNSTMDQNFLPAILWCVGMLIVAYVGAVMIYKKKAN